MPRIEKFVRTTYQFKAVSASRKAAVEAGKEAYDHHEIEEGDEEFIKFESLEEIPAPKGA